MDARLFRDAVRQFAEPSCRRGLSASRGRSRLSVPAELPRRPSPVSRAPRRSPPFAEAYRWVRPSCRNPSRKAAPLPCHQLPAPSSRGAQGQESASGGRREGLRAVLRRPRAGGPAAPLQDRASGTITKLTAGRRVRRAPAVSPGREGSAPGSALTFRLSPGSSGQAFRLLFLFFFVRTSTSARRQAGRSPVARHWPACVLGQRLLQPLLPSHP